MDALRMILELLDIFVNASHNPKTGKFDFDRGCFISIGILVAIALFFGALYYFMS